LDRKFDPTKHIYEFQAMEGNLAYVQDAMQRFDQDTSRMLGMTNPADTLNPEVMKDGNSGYKLQLAMGPNQLIQDEMVKNCAVGLKDLIYIVWKTMIQYSDDYNMQQLADAMLPGAGFLDAKSMENFDFIDRNMINIDLALGFLSDENRLTRQQLIAQAQAQFAQLIAQLDPSVPELFAKARRPFEDTLYTLGVKNCDSYLPTLEEAAKVMQAKSQQPPSADQQETQSKVAMNQAKVGETQMNTQLLKKKIEDMDIDNYYTGLAAKKGKLSAVEMD